MTRELLRRKEEAEGVRRGVAETVLAGELGADVVEGRAGDERSREEVVGRVGVELGRVRVEVHVGRDEEGASGLLRRRAERRRDRDVGRRTGEVEEEGGSEVAACRVACDQDLVLANAQRVDEVVVAR